MLIHDALLLYGANLNANNIDLDLRSFKVHAPAQTALREVLNSLQSNEMDVFYAIRSRVKSVKKIIDKTVRKRNSGKPAYCPEDMTDVVGIRIVTLFREDVIPHTPDSILISGVAATIQLL